MYTILFADDTDVVRNLLCAALREEGYAVLEAGDGYEGILLSRHHTGPIHLLLTDIVMPRIGGLELSRAFKAHHPEASVLFMSGYTADMLDPEVSFLQKPFTPDTLLSRVAGILSQSEATLTVERARFR